MLLPRYFCKKPCAGVPLPMEESDEFLAELLCRATEAHRLASMLEERAECWAGSKGVLATEALGCSVLHAWHQAPAEHQEHSGARVKCIQVC
jgi:hypothetical protein